MKTKEEKIKILSEAIQILSEEIQVLSTAPATPTPAEGQGYPTPQFNKYRDQVLALHGQGYTTNGIARALNIGSTNVGNWVLKLGLVPNRHKKGVPGSKSRKKTLTGKTAKYDLLTVKEQNKKLKEEAHDERSNSELQRSENDGVTGS